MLDNNRFVPLPTLMTRLKSLRENDHDEIESRPCGTHFAIGMFSPHTQLLIGPACSAVP